MKEEKLKKAQEIKDQIKGLEHALALVTKALQQERPEMTLRIGGGYMGETRLYGHALLEHLNHDLGLRLKIKQLEFEAL